MESEQRPPEPDCRPEVRRFATAVEAALMTQKRAPGLAEAADLTLLYYQLLEEIGELASAMRSGDILRIRQETADIGAAAMWIRERCGYLHRSEPNESKHG